jgi:hypothetical protein
MRVLGIRPHKDRFEWALVEGADRQAAQIVEMGKCPIPDLGSRGQELGWVRAEVHALLDRLSPDQAAVDVCEPSIANPGRSEVDGVVQEALGARQVPTARLYAASVRSRYKVKTKADLLEALEAVPVIATTPKSRREPVIAAVAELPP